MGEYEFKIECYHKFSWGYVCSKREEHYQFWADNAEALKRKVLSKGLPWDETKVPKPEPIKIRTNYIEIEGTPAQFRLPWCKSNYKRY